MLVRQLCQAGNEFPTAALQALVVLHFSSQGDGSVLLLRIQQSGDQLHNLRHAVGILLEQFPENWLCVE